MRLLAPSFQPLTASFWLQVGEREPLTSPKKPFQLGSRIFYLRAGSNEILSLKTPKTPALKSISMEDLFLVHEGPAPCERIEMPRLDQASTSASAMERFSSRAAMPRSSSSLVTISGGAMTKWLTKVWMLTPCAIIFAAI